MLTVGATCGLIITRPHATLRPARIADQPYTLEVADTNAARASGLGGRDALSANRGMLFVYDTTARRCFWMKDMRFPLDIIWVDARKHVTHIEHALSPATYPSIYCAAGAYVIELNAGEAARIHLQTSQSITF